MMNLKMLLRAAVMLAVTLVAATAFADMAPGPRCGCQLAPGEVSYGAAAVVAAALGALNWRRR